MLNRGNGSCWSVRQFPARPRETITQSRQRGLAEIGTGTWRHQWSRHFRGNRTDELIIDMWSVMFSSRGREKKRKECIHKQKKKKPCFQPAKSRYFRCVSDRRLADGIISSPIVPPAGLFIQQPINHCQLQGGVVQHTAAGSRHLPLMSFALCGCGSAFPFGL